MKPLACLIEQNCEKENQRRFKRESNPFKDGIRGFLRTIRGRFFMDRKVTKGSKFDIHFGKGSNGEDTTDPPSSTASTDGNNGDMGEKDEEASEDQDSSQKKSKNKKD